MIETFGEGISELWDARFGRAALIVAIGLVVLRVASAVIGRWLLRRGDRHRSLVAKKAVIYLGSVALLLAAAKVAKIDLSTYLAAAGVLTVAVGFAAQTSIGNLVAGIFLLIDRPFEVGDHVQIEGKDGNVESISLMSTHIRTFDNLLVRWPNDTVLRAMIVNFARNPAWRLDLPFRIAYGTDVERARRAVSDRASRNRYVLLDPPPSVWAIRIDDSGIALELRAWVDRAEFLDARTELVIAIHDSLLSAGIEIPYPQLAISHGRRPFDTPREEVQGDEVVRDATRRDEQLDSPSVEADPL